MAKGYGATSLIGGGTGALDAIPVAGLSDGDACTVYTSSGVYHYHLDASSGATENSPYVIAPDDVSSGDQRWILVTPQGSFSHVRASDAAGQTITKDTWETVIFGTEDYDDLDEYVHTTGLFTAKYAGRYLVQVSAMSDNVAWITANFISLRIEVDSVIVAYGLRNVAGSSFTNYLSSQASTTIDLAVGEVIRVQTYISNASNVDLINSGDYNRLTIDRIV